MPQNNISLIGTISHFFATNKPLSTLVVVFVLLFGLFAFLMTPKQYNPEITRPAFAITLNYTGASIEAATDRVVYELIEKVRTVPGVDEVYTEVHDGTTIITTVIFTVGYDTEKAKVDLTTQLQQHSYLAEGFIAQPAIIEINPETIPVLQIVFSNPTESVATLREQVTTLTHTLGDVPNISELNVTGGYEPALVVSADLNKLAAADLSIDTLANTLASSQRSMRSGSFNSGTHAVEFVFDATTDSAAAVGLLPLPGGAVVRDVASVYEGVAGTRSYVLHHTTTSADEVVMLSVAKVEGSSAPVVTTTFLQALDTVLKTEQFASVHYEVVANDGATAAAEIYGLTKNLLTSIAIVVGVLIMFLSVRAAVVVAIAIPTTLLIVFGLGFLFDQTINRITLFALILSLGLLVDSAIVVTENIYAHLKAWERSDKQESRATVVAQAVSEIGAGLILSTVTSVIVFLPMAYITGMMGPYMGPIAFFVPAALTVSLIVAIVITPFVAVHILHGDERPNQLNQFFSRLMTRLTHAYTRFLHRVLLSRPLQRRVLLGALVLFLASLILPATGIVHFQMLPKADRDQFYVYIDLPVDSSTESTRTFSTRVADAVLGDSDVLSTELFVGTAPIVDFNGMFKGAQNRTAPSVATLRVNLSPTTERSRSSTDIVIAARAKLTEELGTNASYVRLIEEPPGPPVMATFVAKVSGDDAEQRAAAKQLNTLLSSINGVVDRHISTDAPVAQVRYQFDHTVAAALGVTLPDVERAIALLGGNIAVSEFIGSTNAEFTPLVLSIDRSLSQPADIYNLTLRGATGAPVPLSAVLSSNHELRPSRVDFDGATAVTYVTADVEGRSIVYVMIDLIRTLIQGDLAPYTVTSWNLFGMELTHHNTGAHITLTWDGEWKMTLENFRDLGIAMGVALVLVYGILVAQYNRFATPAYILVTVPLGLVGILAGFLILDTVFGIYLTATALIGFIALIGIVVNNAIILLEYVDQQQAAGHSFRHALMSAGEARLRPIVLTSLTTVLGSLTIAGDPVWSGLAWAIVFGLSFSTVLTLIIYPTLLVYFNAGTE